MSIPGPMRCVIGQSWVYLMDRGHVLYGMNLVWIWNCVGHLVLRWVESQIYWCTYCLQSHYRLNTEVKYDSAMCNSTFSLSLARIVILLQWSPCFPFPTLRYSMTQVRQFIYVNPWHQRKALSFYLWMPYSQSYRCSQSCKSLKTGLFWIQGNFPWCITCSLVWRISQTKYYLKGTMKNYMVCSYRNCSGHVCTICTLNRTLSLLTISSPPSEGASDVLIGSMSVRVLSESTSRDLSKSAVCVDASNFQCWRHVNILRLYTRERLTSAG